MTPFLTTDTLLLAIYPRGHSNEADIIFGPHATLWDAMQKIDLADIVQFVRVDLRDPEDSQDVTLEAEDAWLAHQDDPEAMGERCDDGWHFNDTALPAFVDWSNAEAVFNELIGASHPYHEHRLTASELGVGR